MPRKTSIYKIKFKQIVIDCRLRGYLSKFPQIGEMTAWIVKVLFLDVSCLPGAGTGMGMSGGALEKNC